MPTPSRSPSSTISGVADGPQAKSQGAVDVLRAGDPALARLIDRLDPVDLASWRARWSLDSFGSLARAIVGQQIATRAAAAIFARLQSYIGERDATSAIAGASDTELRTIGLSAAKAASIRDLAAKVAADEGIPNTKEASMAKAYAAQLAVGVCAEAVQVAGAAGLMRDDLLEKWFRDIKVYDIFEGTGQIQRIVIARRLLEGLKNF